MTTTDPIVRGLFWFAFLSFALFATFSIAGMNAAVGVATLAWIVAAARRRGPAPAFRAWRDPILLASVLLAASAIPSVFMSENMSRAANDWRSYWELLIYIIVGVNIYRHGAREWTFWMLLAAAAVSCTVAFVQRAGGLDLGPIHIGGEHRVGSTLYTMTFAGILYQLVILNVAVLLSRGMAGWQRLLVGVAAAMQFTAILLTMTRGAWVALVAGLITVCLLIRNRTVAILAGVFLVALVVFSFVYSQDQGRTISIKALMESAADRNVGTRLVLWDIAWELFREHPIAGVGMGDYTIEADKLVGDRSVTTTVDTHNVYLHILATRGIIGAIPFLLFWVVLLRELFRSKNRLPRGSLDWSYLVGAIGATVAVMVGALTENNVDDSEVFMVFMFVLGLARSRDYDASAAPR